MYYMTFVESSEEATQLKVYVNADNKLFIEMGPEASDDFMIIQQIQLGKADAERLLLEIQTLLRDYEIKN